jgi:hypothetical protein
MGLGGIPAHDRTVNSARSSQPESSRAERSAPLRLRVVPALPGQFRVVPRGTVSESQDPVPVQGRFFLLAALQALFGGGEGEHA